MCVFLAVISISIIFKHIPLWVSLHFNVGKFPFEHTRVIKVFFEAARAVHVISPTCHTR